LRSLETNLWQEVEMQRRYAEQLEYERMEMRRRLEEMSVRDSSEAMQLRSLLANYEQQIARSTADKDRLAALLSQTSSELQNRESMIASSEIRLHELQDALAETSTNLGQWQTMYESIRTNLQGMEAAFESQRASATQLQEMLMQKDMQLQSDHMRFNEMLLQRDAELNHAETLLRSKDDEIMSLRSESMQLRMQPPMYVENTVIAPPAPVYSSYYETTSTVPTVAPPWSSSNRNGTQRRRSWRATSLRPLSLRSPM
jgi:chromosome segregation ATPase